MARVSLTVLGALITFLFLSSPVGRGFLPSERRTIWLDAMRTGDGCWEVQVFDICDEEPMPPDEKDVLRVQLVENSMGRASDTLGMSLFRASRWILVQSIDSDDAWRSWEETQELGDLSFEPAVREFVEREIIPSSPAMDFWPHTPVSSRRYEAGAWLLWQHRTSLWAIAAWTGVCLGSGLVFSEMVLRAARATQVRMSRWIGGRVDDA